MIKNIIFDLGGVVLTLDQSQAIRRFKEIGLKDAEKWLDAYTQQGIFGELECGQISAEEFRQKLSEVVGKELTHEECLYGWQGYCKEVPMRNLKALLKLRAEGYRVILLSNTNPYMMEWARSNDFSGDGHPLDYYFDKMYLSYEMKIMKPAPELFQKVLLSEKILPEETLFVDDGPRNVAMASQLGIMTFCPENGKDWTEEIYRVMRLSY